MDARCPDPGPGETNPGPVSAVAAGCCAWQVVCRPTLTTARRTHLGGLGDIFACISIAFDASKACVDIVLCTSLTKAVFPERLPTQGAACLSFSGSGTPFFLPGSSTPFFFLEAARLSFSGSSTPFFFPEAARLSFRKRHALFSGRSGASCFRTKPQTSLLRQNAHQSATGPAAKAHRRYSASRSLAHGQRPGRQRACPAPSFDLTIPPPQARRSSRRQRIGFVGDATTRTQATILRRT
jgi:hypothetical protein